VWFGESGGYGGWGTIFSVCEHGLDCGGIQTENLYYECSMTEEEYAAALEELKNIDDEDLEWMEECDPVTMVKNGCKPSVVYYVPLGTAKYNDELEYLENFEDVFDCLCFEPLERWVDMDSSELEEWVEVAKKLDKGIHSSYDS
jgi:hypothetical protein